MRYISVFSGIEAATVAWEPLGWEPVCFSEIDPFPSAVLAHRFPNVPNYGDITKIDWSEVIERHGTVDLVVGGSPCQSFSIAGGRESLDGESALCFEYWRCLHDVRPRWFVWENVPGVFSTRDNAFGQFLGKLEDIGYGMAWRTLDAQFFGVAQRRRRVFLVGHLGGMVGAAAAVLFERDSLRGNTKTSREKRQSLAADAGFGSEGENYGFKFHQGGAAKGIGFEAEQSPTLIADWHNPAVISLQTDHLSQNGTNVSYEVCKTLDVASQPPAICMARSLTSNGDDVFPPLCATDGSKQFIDNQSVSSGRLILEERGACVNVICVSDDNAKAAIDEDMSGSLKVGGGYALASNGEEAVGSLAARDCKGVGSQYVSEGKVICQRLTSSR